jgi:type I restriction enzyme M protein
MSVRAIVKSIQDIMRQDVGVDGDAQRISQLCWLFFLKIIDDQDQELELIRPGYESPIPDELQWRNWASDQEGATGDTLLTFVNDELFPQLKALPLSGVVGDRALVVRGVFEDAYNYMKSGHLLRQVVNKIDGVDFNDLSERQHFGDIYEQILNDLQSAGNAGEYYTPRAVTAFMADRIDPRPGEILFDPACGTGGFLTCSLRHMRDRYVKRPEDEQTMQAALRAVEKKQLPHMLCVTNMLLHGVEDPSFVRHDNTLARPYISYGQSDRVDKARGYNLDFKNPHTLADNYGEPPTLRGGLVVMFGVTVSREDRPGKCAAVPARLHDQPAVAGVLQRKFARITAAHKPEAWIMPKPPRDPGNRDRDGF